MVPSREDPVIRATPRSTIVCNSTWHWSRHGRRHATLVYVMCRPGQVPSRQIWVRNDSSEASVRQRQWRQRMVTLVVNAIYVLDWHRYTDELMSQMNRIWKSSSQGLDCTRVSLAGRHYSTQFAVDIFCIWLLKVQQIHLSTILVTCNL